MVAIFRWGRFTSTFTSFLYNNLIAHASVGSKQTFWAFPFAVQFNRDRYCYLFNKRMEIFNKQNKARLIGAKISK
jgi:hypothetical protein